MVRSSTRRLLRVIGIGSTNRSPCETNFSNDRKTLASLSRAILGNTTTKPGYFLPTRAVAWMNSAVVRGTPTMIIRLSRSMSTPWDIIADAAIRWRRLPNSASGFSRRDNVARTSSNSVRPVRRA